MTQKEAFKIKVGDIFFTEKSAYIMVEHRLGFLLSERGLIIIGSNSSLHCAFLSCFDILKQEYVLLSTEHTYSLKEEIIKNHCT